MPMPRTDHRRSQRPEQADPAASIDAAMNQARALVAIAAGVPPHKVRIRINRPH